MNLSVHYFLSIDLYSLCNIIFIVTFNLDVVKTFGESLDFCRSLSLSPSIHFQLFIPCYSFFLIFIFIFVFFLTWIDLLSTGNLTVNSLSPPFFATLNTSKQDFLIQNKVTKVHLSFISLFYSFFF